MFLAAFLTLGIIQTQELPKAFLGEWSGKMEWVKAGETKGQTVDMALAIASKGDGTYRYELGYGAEKRPYVLRPKDPAKGHWVIDEQNGIALEAYLIGNCLSSAFTVNGNTIVTTLRPEGKALISEMVTLDAKILTTTGGGDVPPVTTNAIKSIQRVVLKRK